MLLYQMCFDNNWTDYKSLKYDKLLLKQSFV